MRTTHLARSCVNNSFGCQITFVSHQQLDDLAAGVAFDFCQPLTGVVERDQVCDIVYQYHSMRTPIITAGDRAESLLTRRVPLKHKRDEREIEQGWRGKA